MRHGLLFIVSAPSGTGKTTVVEQLAQRVPDLVKSRSYTSRPARPGETDGVDYNFVNDHRFTSLVDAGGFLEWAPVFGYRYGTAAADTEEHRRGGRDVVLVIDVQGARQVRERGVDAVTIFVLPPSFDVLETRLRRRSSANATEEQLAQRLATARSEVGELRGYDYIVVNDSVDRCVARLQSIVEAERLRSAVVGDEVGKIVATFGSSDR